MRDRIYVFDLDDTLYLERDYVRSGFRHVGQVAADRYGAQGVFEYAWQLFENGIRGDTFDRIVAEFGLPAGAVREFVDEYRDHAPDIELEPDAAEFLGNLPADCAGTGIITDGYAAGQWKKIEALGLNGMIDAIVVTGDHGAAWTKPSELPYRKIEDSWPGQDLGFIYFGDNPRKDFDSPLRLGWEAFRVRREDGLHHDFPHDFENVPVIRRFPGNAGLGTWRVRRSRIDEVIE